MLIFLWHRVAITRRHCATIDRSIDLLLPGHLRSLLFRPLRRLASGCRWCSGRRRRHCCGRGGRWRSCRGRRGWCSFRGRRGRRCWDGLRAGIRSILGQHDVGQQGHERNRRQGRCNARKSLHAKLQCCRSAMPNVNLYLPKLNSRKFHSVRPGGRRAQR